MRWGCVALDPRNTCASVVPLLTTKRWPSQCFLGKPGYSLTRLMWVCSCLRDRPYKSVSNASCQSFMLFIKLLSSSSLCFTDTLNSLTPHCVPNRRPWGKARPGGALAATFLLLPAGRDSQERGYLGSRFRRIKYQVCFLSCQTRFHSSASPLYQVKQLF